MRGSVAFKITLALTVAWSCYVIAPFVVPFLMELLGIISAGIIGVVLAIIISFYALEKLWKSYDNRTRN